MCSPGHRGCFLTFCCHCIQKSADSPILLELFRDIWPFYLSTETSKTTPHPELLNPLFRSDKGIYQIPFNELFQICWHVTMCNLVVFGLIRKSDSLNFYQIRDISDPLWPCPPNPFFKLSALYNKVWMQAQVQTYRSRGDRWGQEGSYPRKSVECLRVLR